jgi:membrane-bound serine protease (ClpP class)
MFVFPSTPIGRRIMLQRSLVSGEGEKSHSLGLLGHEGRALTPLRPAGTALIDNRRVDVVAEGELIELGDPVIVVYEEGMRVVVRKSAGPSAAVV